MVDYENWGLAESGNREVALVKTLSEAQLKQAMGISIPHVDLSGYSLKKTGLVQHYQGKDLPVLPLAVMRFGREDGKNDKCEGEHISIAIDLMNNRLIGLTRMCATLTGDRFVSHQDALNAAVAFLKQVAPDLISKETEIPTIGAQEQGSEMKFEPAIKIGNVELRWINKHKEEIIANGKTVDVYGMKVKMHIPQYKLWAWVIVDKEGNILTFERNIFWNFDKYQRETQMWLHDKWIATHEINYV